MEPLILPPDLDSLEHIGQYVLNAAQVAGIPKKKAYRLRLAVDELVTNIINYGYANQASPIDLEVRAEVGEDFLKIILVDAGQAYDPRERDFDESILEKPIEERPIGGLGIFLALKNVDEFTYQAQSERNISSFLVRLEKE